MTTSTLWLRMVLLVGFGMAAAPWPAVAIQNEWTGGNNDWQNAGNWSVGVPTAGNTVVIDLNSTTNVQLSGTPPATGDIYVFSSSQLTLKSGANLTAQTLTVGLNSLGTVRLDDSDTKITLTGASVDLTVGSGATGTLFVAGEIDTGTGSTKKVLLGANGGSGSLTVAGGVLETNGIDVQAGSTGALYVGGGTIRANQNSTSFFATGLDVNVNTAGLYFDTNGFDVGVSSAMHGTGYFVKKGAGTLTLSGASTYTAGTFVANGTVLLSGTGASINTGTFVTNIGASIGNVDGGGSGRLEIRNGATVTNGGGQINSAAGSSALVSGTGSAWTNGGALSVGTSGTGSLTIEDGASVSSTAGAIGYAIGSQGTVLITGSGSIWNTTDDVVMANVGGTSELTVADGGEINVNSGPE